MFTAADLRNIAIQIEKNGEQTYRTAAQQVASENVAAMLTWMAEEEQRHCKWLEGMQFTEQPLTTEQQEIEALGRGLLQDMVKGQTFSLETDNLQSTQYVNEVLVQCQDFEAETVMFYEFLLPLVEGEGAEQQLQTIINEEKKHMAQLTELAAAFVADMDTTMSEKK
ncbi:MAG: hypothetical protein CSB34_04575 [Desulfobulbus propionicus]|nr:MAG: hypothetical protein CSB34_04575 [Desulfobulbus propionicus]